MTSPKISILFVDDEVSILDALRRQCRRKRDEWNVRYALSADDGLAALSTEPSDVVVSDMRMPGMDGACFLKIVRERWPGTIRLILSGQTEQGQLLSSIGSIHQFLQKPCDPDQVSAVVARIRRHTALLHSSALRGMAAFVESLPVLSKTYSELTKIVGEDREDVTAIAQVVSKDIGISTKLLQLVNSAFFGLPRRIADVKNAVALLGLRQLKALALASSVFDTLAEGSETAPFVERLWNVSGHIGARAATLALEARCTPEERDISHLCGTLSLVGRALLIRQYPGPYRRILRDVQERGISLSRAESDEFGCGQQSVGAYALGLWAFDDQVVQGVALQAEPSLRGPSPVFHAERFVQAARCIEYGEQLADPLRFADDQLQSRTKECA